MANPTQLNSQESLTQALTMAVLAHHNQVDKGGKPYILHPLRLMHQLEDINLKVVALLHDVVEDSEITIADLYAKGFSEEVIQAIEALTKNDDESYQDFIQRVTTNNWARQVKILDIKDNLDLSRLPTLTEKDLLRLAKYHQALSFLQTKQQ